MDKVKEKAAIIEQYISSYLELHGKSPRIVDIASAEVSAEDMRAAASGAAASEAAVPVRNGEKQKSGGQVSNLVRSSVLINVFNNENEPFR